MYIVNKKLDVIQSEIIESHYGLSCEKVGYTVKCYDDESNTTKWIGYVNFFCEVIIKDSSKMKDFMIINVAALNEKNEIIACGSDLYIEKGNFHTEWLWKDQIYVSNYKKVKALKIYIS